MSLIATVGQSRHAVSQEAGAQAAQQALEGLGMAQATFGWVIASYVHSIQDVLAGISRIMADTPVLGFSTSAELTSIGQERRSVVVGLLSGDDLHARAGWWPDFVKESRGAVGDLFRSLRPKADEHENLFVIADGLSGDTNHLCQVLTAGRYGLAGCLAGGDLTSGRTYQLGGRRGGDSGLAAAVLGGNVTIGVGTAHGWLPVGATVQLSEVQDLWVRSLDGRRPSETYAQLFGYPARDWSFPPLNELVRLYPFGLSDGDELLIRSPLRVEADGSLRMNTTLPEGQTAALMVGSRAACFKAARQAAREALAALGPARPSLALVLADVAWQTMMETQPGAEVRALRQELGDEVPIIGGYTFGQFARSPKDGRVRLLNQHIEVILFGEKTGDPEGYAD
ncbi:FIST signal transduction protein [Chloroflexota bacterium]